MTEPLELFKSVLRQHGQSVTYARQIVFEALLDREPQPMQSLVRTCEASVNRASVYRVVTLFEQLGIVQRLQVGWKYTLELTDTFHRHHHHLTCRHCGVIIPLDENEVLEQQLHDAASKHGFIMQSHQLEIQGLCSACRPKHERA